MARNIYNKSLVTNYKTNFYKHIRGLSYFKTRLRKDFKRIFNR